MQQLGADDPFFKKRQQVIKKSTVRAENMGCRMPVYIKCIVMYGEKTKQQVVAPGMDIPAVCSRNVIKVGFKNTIRRIPGEVYLFWLVPDTIQYIKVYPLGAADTVPVKKEEQMAGVFLFQQAGRIHNQPGNGPGYP